MDNLVEIAQLTNSCARCALHKNRYQAVPGEGPADAPIVLLGEAPGARENTTGRPFVGAAGRTLDMMLQEAGISRGDCFITNMVKCWPGEGNPDPAPEEIEACAPFLDAQLDIIQPLGIVTFGRYSTSKWIEFSTMRSVQGVIRKFEWPNGQPCFVMPVYHPAYIGRNPAEKEGAVEALRNFREVVYRE